MKAQGVLWLRGWRGGFPMYLEEPLSEEEDSMLGDREEPASMSS